MPSDIIVSQPTEEDRKAALSAILTSKALPAFVFYGIYNGYMSEDPRSLGNKIGWAMKRWDHWDTEEQALCVAFIGQTLLDIVWVDTGIMNGDAECDREGHRESRAWLSYVESDDDYRDQFEAVCDVAGFDASATLTMLKTFHQLTPDLVINEAGELSKVTAIRRPRPAKIDPLQLDLLSAA